MIGIIFLAVALSMDAIAISIGLKSKEKSIWSDSIEFKSEPKKTPSLTQLAHTLQDIHWDRTRLTPLSAVNTSKPVIS
tara:strand:+ start:82072 stop:82305 length:234 start_codon:yes stop_codon:yes gene_type:complete